MNSQSKDQQRERILKEALADFLISFSHKARTPLSVIWNDLQYWKKSLNLEEADRALARCREITELLSSLTELAQESPKSSGVKWSELFNSNFSLTDFSLQIEQDNLCEVEPRRIAKLLANLDQFLNMLASPTDRHECLIILRAKSFELAIPITSKMVDFQTDSASALSKKFEIQNSLEPPLIDFICLLESLDAQYSYSSGSLKMIFEFN